MPLKSRAENARNLGMRPATSSGDAIACDSPLFSGLAASGFLLLRCATLWLCIAFAGSAWSIAASTPEKVDFNFQVRPILADRCFKCHGPDEKTRKAKLRLDQKESAYAIRDQQTG